MISLNKLLLMKRNNLCKREDITPLSLNKKIDLVRNIWLDYSWLLEESYRRGMV